MTDLDTAKRIIDATRRIAIVGASERSERDSYRIMQYLLRQGYTVFPVNPNAHRILEQDCLARLDEVPAPLDTVVCFRRSEFMEQIAREAVAAGAKHLWMQFGVVNPRAAEIAREAGLLVVMDRCIMIDHRRFGATAA